MEHAPWLKDVIVFFVAAGLVVPLFHHARIGAVLGFLLVGVAAGPYGLGQLVGDYSWIRYLTIEDRSRVDTFAEFGVIFLLFLIGLDMSVERLWALRRYVIGIGGAQFVLSALAIAIAAKLIGGGLNASIVLGLCLAMSSTAIVMRLLEDQGRTATLTGRLAVSVLLFQDLMVAPVLLATEVLGRGGSNLAVALGWALVQALIAVVVIGVAGRLLLRPLLGIAAKTGSRELIMAISLAIVIGASLATAHAGLSTSLGAFLAGVLLSETAYRHQVEVDLAPVKGLLLGVFFVSVGMTIDVRAVWAGIEIVVGIVALLFVVKAIVLYGACRMFKVGASASVETAILLAQAGEFAFVVIGRGLALEILTPQGAQLATAVAGISMMLTPLLAVSAAWLARRMQHIDQGHQMPGADAGELKDHVVIGGYGRVGQTIGRLLAAENVRFVALDLNGDLVAEARGRGDAVYFGDAARAEFLERIGVAQARAFIVTVNAPHAAERMVAAVRRLRPDAPVFARARDSEHAARLVKLGAVDVIPEAVEASLQLGTRLMESLGLPGHVVMRRVAVLREQELGRLAQPDDDRTG